MSLFGDIAGLAAINAAYNKLGGIGTSAQSAANTLATDVFNKSKFQPFSISSGIGTTNVRAKGALDTGLTGQAANVQNAMFARSLADVTGGTAGTFGVNTLGQQLVSRAGSELVENIPGYSGLMQAMGRATDTGMDFMREAGMPVAAREQQVFDRIRAAQRPEEERQRLELEERLATQGRLGVRTNLYGGTPEQLALSKAQSEAQNMAMLQAMQQARAEQAQAGQLAGQFTGLGGTLAGQLQNLQGARQTRGLGLASAGLGLLQGREALEAAELQQSLGALKGALMPEAANLNLIQQGLVSGKLAQSAQQFGTGLFGEARMSGIDALLASGLGQANLMGNVGAGVLAASAQSEQDGLFDLLDSLIPSDIRLKENIVFIGKNHNGFNIYSWDWNEKANEVGMSGSDVGVLAQELLETEPSRVSVDSSGYYRVDYKGVWG